VIHRVKFNYSGIYFFLCSESLDDVFAIFQWVEGVPSVRLLDSGSLFGECCRLTDPRMVQNVVVELAGPKGTLMPSTTLFML
jgi:hypothetical protein